MLVRSILVASAILVSGIAVRAADPAAIEQFEKKVRPILVQNCLGCHGPQKQKGGLRLDSGAAVLKGGDSGPVIVAREPGKSRLIDAIGYKNVELQMPPKGKLPDAAIADLTEWVRNGAAWPAESVAATTAMGGFDLAARKAAHWAWKPVRAEPPPAVRNESWPHGPIDRFILAKLETSGLAPAPAADKRTLIRRVTFDLIGLPPTAAEIDAFLADKSADAYRASRRPAANESAFRRTLGPALARPDAVCRDAWPRVRLPVAERLAISRLRHSGDQRRRALRSIRDRTHCRRLDGSAAAQPRHRRQ